MWSHTGNLYENCGIAHREAQINRFHIEKVVFCTLENNLNDVQASLINTPEETFWCTSEQDLGQSLIEIQEGPRHWCTMIL